MTNELENDYEKKFQEDLEKATALSLETLALDQYRRSKLQYSHSDVAVSSSTISYRQQLQQLQQQQQQQQQQQRQHNDDSYNNSRFFNQRSSFDSFGLETSSSPSSSSLSTGSRQNAFPSRMTNSALPTPPPPPRRYSETHVVSSSNNRKSPNETAPTGSDNVDLISFTSPTSDKKDRQSLDFDNLLEEIQRLNSQTHSSQQQQQQAHNLTMYGSTPSLASSSNLQLVPYAGNQQQQGQKTALTNEQLNQLYNMQRLQPQMPYHYQQQATIYNKPYFSTSSTSMASSSSSSSLIQTATSATQFNYPPQAPAYGFQMHLFPTQNAITAFNQMTVLPPHQQSSSPSPSFQGGINRQLSSQSSNTSNESSSIISQSTPLGQIPKSSSNIDNLCKIASSSLKTSNSSASSEDNRNFRRNKKTGTTKENDDLIDLGQEDNSRVSVLEAFDPLLIKEWEDADKNCDNLSDCTTSYYTEYDPFDYLYSCGTQYSDPVYDAVNKTDRTPITPNAPAIGWNLTTMSQTSTFPSTSQDEQQQPPPLPPRNSITTNKLDIPTIHHRSSGTATATTTQTIKSRLYENVIDRKTNDPELMEFYKMIKELRSNYKYNDELTNIGHVIASEFQYTNHLCEDKSIKILVYPSNEILKDNQLSSSNNNDKQITQIQGYGTPVIFTCDISTTVEHVIMHVYCALEGKIIGSASDFVLKPIGITEWLSTSSKLNQLECVHDCIKLERDVQFGLCLKTDLNMKIYARTAQDDARDMDLKPEDILPNEHESTITFNNMMILIETLETEIDKLEIAANDIKKLSHTTILSCSGVVQAIKAICALLGSIDTLDISNNVDELKKFCSSISQINYSNNSNFNLINNDTIIKSNNPNIITEYGDYAEIKLKPKTILDIIQIKCNQLRDSVQKLIQTYSNEFRVDFCVKNCLDYVKVESISITYILEPIIVNISCLHRPPPNWKYDDYMIGAQIYHGTRFIGEPIVIQYSNDTTTNGLFPRLKFDTWITFDKSPLICSLPRESRLIFVLYGCTIEPTTDTNTSGNNISTTTTTTVNSNSSVNNSGSNNEQITNENIIERKQINTELGWAAIQLFDFERHMINGTHLLSLWPPTTDKFLGPAPAKGCHPHPDYCPVLSIEIPDYGGNIIFPEPIENSLCAPRFDFNSLDHNLQEELLDTAEQGYIMSLDKREVFWEKRHYLQSFPHALPKVLHSAHSWDYDSLQDLYSLLKSWTPLSPLQALELLLPRYPDIEVRAKAVEWISKMSNDQLNDFLPQLLQSLKHDTYEVSPMAKFLLSKCLESPRIAHHLYWLLVHSLPGDAPQNSIDGSYSGGGGMSVGGGINTTIINSGNSSNSGQYDEMLITQARYHRRNKMLLRSLLAVCGEKLLSRFLKQNMMCKTLADTAQAVKRSKESLRQQTLIHGMEMVNQILVETSTSLPLGPGYEVYGINLRGCSYFNSYTLPLKIAFYGPDHGILPAIFKYGDDLQQDMLTIQLVRIMDKLWLAEGLDLKMVTFNCVPTGHKKGMIELVSDAETLRKIQVEYGLTGSFKDRPIAEWLAKKNPSQLEYQRAVDNFTCSCAGYSVATYILGICDRHNDNIMLKTSGHLFHIDFGKFLGDAQMFGNFKRDRTPFVLTSDMAYVINGGDKPSTKFHHFVDLCCRAFNIVRNHGDLLLHMLALMATAGIPGVTSDAITYVRRALLPSQSNPEAAATFAKMIQYSLKNWFTQFNFFLHNLAQLRFSNDDGNGELLNFVPRTYTMQQDGRLKSVTVHGYQKRYELEKYYAYILKVTRQSQPDPAYLFRSYKEFQEFHQKLCLHFPLAKLHSLPSGSGLGRSNVKTVAERRLPEIQKFLITLFNSADEIAHSDLVYTFFHPLLRDQQEADIHVSKVKEIKAKHKTENVSGEIKLSLQYRRGTLTVMIHHVRGLPLLTGGQEPNTYVKCYLKPDTMKSTKRKTKVVRKTCVPSFMETLEYRMPLECIQNRILQVTVWSHDTLQENELLGGFELPLSQYDLREELCQWFRLGYLPRS